MRILYVIVKALTFPGTLLHALWEHCLCRKFHCTVEDARYFQANELCGHVEHEFMPSKGKRFLICFLPFLFNLVLGLLIVIPASVHVMKLQQFNNIFYLLMLWLGISLLTSLFPLVEDALAMWESFYGAGNEANLAAKILLFPIIAVLVAGAYLERWGITLVTSSAAAWFLPELLSPIAGALASANDSLGAWLAKLAEKAQNVAEAATETGTNAASS